jgi:uncharacterized protein YceH (UPF0502 family)
MTPPQLTFEELRVLGALIEKSQATPEYYPLTLNALTQACNQRSSRDPVVDFEAGLVEDVLEHLRDRGLVAFSSGTGRVVKFYHRIGQNGLGLTPAQAAVLSIIMLRGPQTASEIRARSGRQFHFTSQELAQETIAGLMTEEKPFLEEAPRRVGQKETRYRHRLAEWKDDDAAAEAPSVPARAASVSDGIRELAGRIERLAERIDELERRLAVLEPSQRQ